METESEKSTARGKKAITADWYRDKIATGVKLAT
jgi:hypothetical protein